VKATWSRLLPVAASNPATKSILILEKLERVTGIEPAGTTL
jgi:hypothetical protein